MEITKKEFNEFIETVKLKYDAEIRIRFRASEVLNYPNDKNGKCFPFVYLCELLKKKYELKIIEPKSGMSDEIIEKLTGISKEKIVYMRENYSELENKFN